MTSRNLPLRAMMNCLIPVVALLLAGPVLAQDPVYREQNEYPILDEIEAARDAA